MDKVDVQKVKVNGVDLAYVEEGKGETVVLVHGSSGDWRTWDGLRPAGVAFIALAGVAVWHLLPRST